MKKPKNCCAQPPADRRGADNRAELARVNRIRGQIEGIGRMLEQRAYCPDIITQIQAARSALGALQGAVLRGHLNDCVRKGLNNGEEKRTAELVEELLAVFKYT